MQTYTYTHEDNVDHPDEDKGKSSEIKGILDMVYTKIKQGISLKCCLVFSTLLMEYRICEPQA